MCANHAKSILPLMHCVYCRSQNKIQICASLSLCITFTYKVQCLPSNLVKYSANPHRFIKSCQSSIMSMIHRYAHTVWIFPFSSRIIDRMALYTTFLCILIVFYIMRMLKALRHLIFTYSVCNKPLHSYYVD